MIYRALPIISALYSILLLVLCSNDSNVFSAITSLCAFFVARSVVKKAKRFCISAGIVASISSVAHLVLTIMVNTSSFTVFVADCG